MEKCYIQSRLICSNNSNVLFIIITGNWPNNAPPSHYNRQYPQQGAPPQQWAGQRPTGPPVMGQPGQPAQWGDQHRYPPQGQPQYPAAQQVSTCTTYKC